MSAKQKKAEKAEVNVTVTEVLQEKAKQSSNNIKNGKEAVKVKLDGKVAIKFTKDYGYMKAGKEAIVSDLAYDIYTKAGVVEKI